MELTWLGHSCFRLRGKDATLITDPPSPATGYSLGRITADIVTISHQHVGHNYVKGIGGDPKVVTGPGEYEISQILISGVQTFHDDEKQSYSNADGRINEMESDIKGKLNAGKYQYIHDIHSFE